jgi:branched-chain amino acid aminotransferase
MDAMCYLNGEIMPVSQAKVGVYDIGLLRGFGIYEAMTTYNRKPFMIADHMARFQASTKRLSLTIPASDGDIASAITKLIESNVSQGKEGVIRFIITGGQAIGGIEYDQAKPTFYILVEELQPLPESTFEKGCTLTIHEHLRQIPECKTTDYLEAVLLQKERRESGSLEILYTYQGNVLECATSNFFIVKNGTIITSKDQILHGITRKVTIDAAKKEFPVEERSMSVEEM